MLPVLTMFQVSDSDLDVRSSSMAAVAHADRGSDSVMTDSGHGSNEDVTQRHHDSCQSSKCCKQLAF